MQAAASRPEALRIERPFESGRLERPTDLLAIEERHDVRLHDVLHPVGIPDQIVELELQSPPVDPRHVHPDQLEVV